MDTLHKLGIVYLVEGQVGDAATMFNQLLEHEYNIYQKLKGFPNVPKCYGLIKGKYLILEHIENDVPQRAEVIDPQPEIVDGQIVVPDRPGIGVGPILHVAAAPGHQPLRTGSTQMRWMPRSDSSPEAPHHRGHPVPRHI